VFSNVAYEAGLHGYETELKFMVLDESFAELLLSVARGLLR
jgi:hypothetical protein